MKARLFRFGRFGATGIASLALILSITWALKLAGVEAPLAYAVALGVAFILNFVLNRHFVFVAGDGCARAQAKRYALASLLMRSMEWLAFYSLHQIVPHIVLIPVIQVVSTLVKFEIYGRLVFAKGGR